MAEEVNANLETVNNEQVGVEQNQGTAPGNAGIDQSEVDRIAGRRSEQATKAALKDYFKQQGMSQEEAEQAFKEWKANKQSQEEAERNNLGALQQRYDSLSRDHDAAIKKANARMIIADATIQAAELGVKSERLNYAVRLADLTDITLDADGRPDSVAIKTAIEQVLRDLPELKATGEENRPGFKLGGPGQNTGATDDKLAEIFGNKKKG